MSTTPFLRARRPACGLCLAVFIALLPFGGSSAAALSESASTSDASEAAPRPMTVDDALDMTRLESAVISPDGGSILYATTELDWKKNERKTRVRMVRSDGGDSWQYLGEDGGSDFAFSPDGRYVTFLRKTKGDAKSSEATSSKAGNEKRQQLFWMRTAGGEATQLTKHDTSVQSYKWGHDSKTIFFLARDERPEEEDKALKAGGDAIFVNEGANGQDLGSWTNLWAFDVESETAHALTEERFVVQSFDPSPDGSRIALAARYRNRRNDGDLTELFVFDVERKELDQLTDNRAPESSVLWSPDGKLFSYLAADDEEWLNRNTKIWIMDPERAEHSLVSGGYEGNVNEVVWDATGEGLLFTGQQGVRSNLFHVDARSGASRQITDSEGWLRVHSYSADRTRFAYAYSDSATPEDLYSGSLEVAEELSEKAPQAHRHGEAVVSRQLTELNPQIADLQRSQLRVVRWPSHDGTEIEGLLHLPIGYEEGKRYPLILNIHGGPAGYFNNTFRASYHVYAGLGYASLSPNVRGSSGYTDTLREGNTTAQKDGIGKGDFLDLMTGVDALIEQGIADPDRLALRGWSYGGILGGWTITQTDRFKAASIGAGVYDWTSEYGPGFNHDVRLWHIGGTPWSNPDGWRGQSTLTHVADITTPTLLLHGDADTTDTEQQSMMLFTAIQDIGKAPVRYLKFPRQPHGIREPRQIRIKDIEEIRWMQKHVLGEDWQPWERAAEDDEEEAEEEAGEAAEDSSQSPAAAG